MDYTTAAASCSDYDSSSLYSDESGLDAPSAHQRPASNLNCSTAAAVQPSPVVVTLRRPQSLLPPGARSSASSAASTAAATSSYRFSMANLEETHEAELDAILGELSMLEQQKTGVTAALQLGQPAAGGSVNTHSTTALLMQQLQQQQQQQTQQPQHHLQHQQHHHHRGHSRTNSMLSHVTNSTISSVSTSSESGNGSGSESGGSSAGGGIGGNAALREPHRTESPDNDSAFSDTVSLLSSESSASSGVSHHHLHSQQQQQQQLQLPANLLPCDSAKAAKIHLALQKLEQASVRRLFVKAFTTDGASKSLLVDERMTCGHVTRLLADKNHVTMEPHWALVEQLPDLQMERLFEDHELLVDNLMNWRSDSKNRVLFVQRPDKVSLYNVPERYLPGTQMAPGSDHDEHTRAMLLDEFFASGQPIAMEGALFLKPDAKKAWKRHHFVLRASGLYYFLKEKTKSTKDMVCHALFDDHDVYRGIGWKKKHKAPTDHTFALRQPRDNIAGKDTAAKDKDKSAQPKLLCAEDADTLDRWLTAIRVAKYGRRLLDNQRTLVDDLQREELERFSANRCGSIGSIISSVPSQCSSALSLAGGRLSRASSSSSSGCLSDEAGAGFDSEFPNTGTIKRKPSMKPNLPLTSMTRQLKEVGETMTGGLSSSVTGNAGGDDDVDEDGSGGAGGGNSGPTSPERGGTLTRRHSRRRSEEGSNSGTLKRRPTVTTTSSASAGSTASAVAAAAQSASGHHIASIVSLHRGSVDSMSSSSTSTATPTGSAPGTPLQSASVSANQLHNTNLMNNNHHHQHQHQHQHHHLQPHHISPLEIMPACMTDSTFSLPPPPPPPLLLAANGGTDELDNISMTGSTLSLESLPPPPPPCDLQHMAGEFSASQTSLVSLPPPPPEIRPMYHMAPVPPTATCMDTIHPVTHFIVPAAGPNVSLIDPASPQPIYAKSTKPSSIIKAPPYKAPPPYNNNSPSTAALPSVSATASGGGGGGGKSVTFADSPVLLRRKQVCFEDQVYGTSPRRHQQQPPAPPSVTMAMAAVAEPLYVSSAPPPPPRAEATRLSTNGGAAALSLSHTSPKRLSDSQANPPPHFLKDLQRVMRKKWQVAQKCKLEPATTPHEVLGFRDFNGELQLVSAAGAAVAGPTHFYRETSNVSNWVQEHYGAGETAPSDDSLYENLGGEMGAEPMPMAMKLMNKRPPPPPPKRSLSTQLSSQQLRSS